MDQNWLRSRCAARQVGLFYTHTDSEIEREGKKLKEKDTLLSISLYMYIYIIGIYVCGLSYVVSFTLYLELHPHVTYTMYMEAP